MKKSALITGCSSGIGYLSALRFAREGYKVFATSRDMKKVGIDELKVLSKKEDLEIEFIKLDVTSSSEIKAITKRIKEYGFLDVLVNNAGYGLMGPVEITSLEKIRHQFDVNYFGLIELTQSLLPMMRERQEGVIINLSSVVGQMVMPVNGIYASSKYAVEAISEAMRYELRSHGIKVILIEPGAFETKFGENEVKGEDWGDGYSELRKRYDGFMSNFGGQDPEKVSDLIYKVAQKDNPKLRYRVGRDAKWSLLLKKILPQDLWVWAIERVIR